VERAAVGRVAAERAAVERAAVERVAAERAAAERAAVERVAAERAAVERVASGQGRGGRGRGGRGTGTLMQVVRPPPESTPSPTVGPPTIAALEGDDRQPSPPASTIAEAVQCIVCMAMERTHVAVPCGHQSMCGGCCTNITQCPICRAYATFIRLIVS
jgi:hypothetical protein